MPLTPPPSAERTHEELLQLLVKIQHLSGKTGSLAEDVAKELHGHMEKEEELVMPLLGLLPEMSSGKQRDASRKRAARLYVELKKEYPKMLNTHKGILKLLSRLRKVGAEEGHLTAVRFAEALENHAKEEEEILYPAALLAGRLASGNAKAN